MEVHLQVDNRDPIRLERCGTTCRATTVTLVGGETIRTIVDGEDEPAVIELSDLPAPDGTALVDLLTKRMGGLTSLRYEEVLGPAAPPVVTIVEMVAPEGIRVVIADSGTEQIRIANTFYLREGSTQSWEVSEGPPVAVPTYVWDSPDKTAVTLVGNEEVGRMSTAVVAFFVNQGGDLPIWYRLSVDDRGWSTGP